MRLEFIVEKFFMRTSSDTPAQDPKRSSEGPFSIESLWQTLAAGWVVAAVSAPNSVPEVVVAKFVAEQDLGALIWRKLEPKDSPPGSLQPPLDGLEVLTREVSRFDKTRVSRCMDCCICNQHHRFAYVLSMLQHVSTAFCGPATA